MDFHLYNSISHGRIMKNKAVESYIVGFLFSVVFTFLAYDLVLTDVNSRHKLFPLIFLLPIILIIACLQLIVQLIFFLHLGKEHAPRWNAFFFISTFMGILLIVIGSIWIMYHLNYNMTPMQMNQYIQNQSGF